MFKNQKDMLNSMSFYSLKVRYDLDNFYVNSI